MSPTSTSRSSYASSLDDGDDEGMIRNRWRRGLSHFVKPALWSPVGAGAAPQIAVSLFLDQEVHGTQGRLALQGCHARCFDRVVDIQDFHLDELLCHGVLHPPSVLLDSRYGGHLCLDQTNRRMEGLRGDRKLRHLICSTVIGSQKSCVGLFNKLDSCVCFLSRFNPVIWLDVGGIIVSMALGVFRVAMSIVCILVCVACPLDGSNIVAGVICGPVGVVGIGLIKIIVVVADKGFVVPMLVIVVVVLVVMRSLVQGVGIGFWGNIGNGEAGEFIGIDGIEVEKGFVVVTVVFRVINRMIGVPRDNEETSVLNERLAIVEGKRFNASDGGVSERKKGPIVAEIASAGGQGEEIVRSLSVFDRHQGNGAKGTGTGRVSRLSILKHLDIRTELEAQGVVVGQRRSSHDGSGAQRVGGAAVAGKHTTEAANDDVDHVTYHQFWHTFFENEAMNRGTEALLGRTDGLLDLADMAVSGHDFHHHGEDVGADILKFGVGVDIANGETTGVVQSNCCGKLAEDGFVGAVGGILHSTKANVAGNCVQETNALDKEEVGAQGHVLMVPEHGRRDGNSLESRSARSGGGASHLTFKDRYVRTIDEECFVSVVLGDQAVPDELISENGLELRHWGVLICSDRSHELRRRLPPAGL